MARRRTKNHSRKSTEARDTAQNSKGKNRPSDSPSESVSKETPSVEQEETKSKTSAAPKDQAHADRVAETLANVERLLSQANDSSSSNAPDWSQAFEASLEKNQNRLSSQLDQFTKRFEKQLNDLEQTISKRLDSESIAQINAQGTDQSNAGAKAEASGESESDWERRKRKMYADYSEDPSTTKDKSKKTKPANSDDGDELTSLQKSLHVSIESLDEVQAEGIDELRAQLTEKLREAEVELSINRAKLDQRKAELERRQTELERREKSFESKYDNVNGTPQKKGVLDRLTRHLGVRKQVDSL